MKKKYKCVDCSRGLGSNRYRCKLCGRVYAERLKGELIAKFPFVREIFDTKGGEDNEDTEV